MNATSATEPQDHRLGSLRIHVAPAASPSSTGVLLYPTIMGLNDNMRDSAREFADAGLTAVVWDPYDGVDGNGEVGTMLGMSQKREDSDVVADLKRVVDHMHDELGLSLIAGIGWCFGGRVGLLHAGSDPRVRALAAYNPTMWSPTPVDIEYIPKPISRADFPEQTMDEFAVARSIRGPVQVCRPAHDFTQPAEYQRMLDALCTRPDPTFYEYYPGAGHGFSYTPGPDNERARRYAWPATFALFAREAAAHDNVS